MPMDHPRYEDRGRLGAGSTGEVRLVFDRTLDREVAMKVGWPGPQGDPERETFLRGARLAARLEHPALVPVYDAGTLADGRPYLTMKRVEGHTLGEALRARGERPADAECLRWVVGVLLRVCEALAYAHGRGVVHCDVNPANVMLGPHGEVYLTDWAGAASSLRGGAGSGPVAGTLGFMAPEQACSQRGGVGPRTDVHGVGATLWFAMTGRPPYACGTVEEGLSATRDGRLPGIDARLLDPSLPAALRAVVVVALAPDPERRFPSADALREALASVLAGEGWFEKRRFAAGSTVLAEGEPGDEAYIVTEGRAEVHSGGHHLRTMGPGDVFGETALLAGGTRTATVTAATDLAVLVVTYASLDAHLGPGAWFSNLVRTLAARFRDTHEALLAERARR